MEKVLATARMVATVEVDVNSSWGESCTVQQIHDQAKEEALSRLGALAHHGIRIVGTPVIKTITYEPKGA